MAHVEAYFWSDGAGTGSPVFLQTMTAQEPAGPVVTVTLAAPVHCRGALAEFAALLNASASLAGTYALTWDEPTNRIRIDCLGPASVDFTFGGNLALALGFNGSLSGAATYTAPDPPLAIVPVVAVDSDPELAAGDQELAEYRHGRARAHFYTNHRLYRIGLVAAEENAQALLDGFCAAGRVRVFQSNSGAVYRPTNLAGYVDGFVAGIADTVEEIGDPPQFVRLEMLISQEVPR